MPSCEKAAGELPQYRPSSLSTFASTLGLSHQASFGIFVEIFYNFSWRWNLFVIYQ